MTTTAPGSNLLTALARLSLALTGSCLLPAAGHAAGFSGSFDPSNWSIINVGGGVADQTLSSNGSPPVTNADYSCFKINDVACAENVDAVSGAVDVVGSVGGQTGGGTAGSSRTTTLTITNGAQSSVLSFNWALATLTTPGATNQIVSYLIGSTETALSSTDGDFGFLTNISLAAGETFGFRVSTTDNSGDYGVLSITNFTASSGPASVPGPLPLAGAAAAFGWSRRLRGRIAQSSS